MTTDSIDEYMDKSDDKDYIFRSFQDALIATMKWVQMSSLLITFFYPDTFFKAIQEKINDPKQTSCVLFVLLSIFSTDLQVLNETYHSNDNSQYTFVVKLQQWLRTTIDKLTESLPSSLSKKAIEILAIQSFDSFINILNLQTRSIDDEESQLIKQLSIADTEQDYDGFIGEAKFAIFSKFNHRKCLIEQHVTSNWDTIIDYMKQHDHLKLYLIQYSAHIFNEITVNFQQLKINTASIQQAVEKICQAGVDKLNVYLSEANEMNKNQSDMIKIKDDHFCDAVNEENEIEQKAYELFHQLNEQMCKANFVNFPSLFDEFY